MLGFSPKHQQEACGNDGACEPAPLPVATQDELCKPYFTHHIPPFCCLRPWRLGSPFLYWSKVGVLQYVVVKLLCTAVVFVTSFTGSYGAGEFTNPAKAYIYIAAVVNFSQMWAIYCLVLFYHELQHELGGLGISPVGKLLLIKSIVFLTWWQSIVIAGAQTAGWIHKTEDYTADAISDGLNNFLISVECFGFAIAHHYLFHWSDCAPVGSPSRRDLAAEAASSDPHASRSPSQQLLTPTYDSESFPPQRGFLSAAYHSILPADIVRETGSALLNRKRTLSSDALLDTREQGHGEGGSSVQATSEES